jgi:hypothetical protein
MRIAVTGCLVFVCLLPARVARADSFTLSAAITTQGIFTCLGGLQCTGSGTNSVVLGSGSNSAILTFNGVNSMFEVGNTTRPVTLGQFTSSASEGFTFPTRTNPNIPILRFQFRMTHSAPRTASSSQSWFYGPGGRSNLPFMMGSTYLSLFMEGPYPEGARYPYIVYSFNEVQPTINGIGTTDLVADAGVVPEPATLILVGGGLAGLIARRRKRMAEVL